MDFLKIGITYKKEKLICSINPFQKCYRLHPNQLTIKEVISIENLVTDLPYDYKTPILEPPLS